MGALGHLTWYEAEAMAKEQKGLLAKIGTEKENKLLGLVRDCSCKPNNFDQNRPMTS